MAINDSSTEVNHNKPINVDYSRPNFGPKKWPIDDDIVICGIGGRFPESDNMDELSYNLLNNIDMVTGDDRRWPIGLNDNQASRTGKVKELDKFDNSYFCTLNILADHMEPGSRIILETAYEAIADAGISPQTIRGSRTGVYVGINTVANAEAIPQDDFSDIRAKDAAFWVYGTSKALLANRISFLFDFIGPSTVIDTACSASMIALANAVLDLRNEICDMAIVASSNICLAPFSSSVFHSLGLMSMDGKCKVFDKSADGFVRSETVGSLFLMRRSQAKRIYATILHAKINTDGFKTIGLFAPFWLRQRNLMIETYQEAGINPNDVAYFESHGTGTNVGDPQEAKAVSEAYCEKRDGLLLVGAVKSNLGHSEGASGLCSIAKAVVIFENKTIPANLHFSEPKPEIDSLYKTIEPVIKNLPFTGEIIGVNSFGVGGANAHVLLKINDKEISDDLYNIVDPIPRLINISGRTREAVEYIFDFIENNPKKVHRDFLALLNDAMKTLPVKGSANFANRGYMIMKKKEPVDGVDQGYEYSKVIEDTKLMQPVWLIFSGMGSQWSGMGKQMMQLDVFRKSIETSVEVLKPYGIDLLKLILSDDESVWTERTVNPFVAITAMQIALFDIYKELQLPIEGIIGHSFGEIACAYADDCISAEEAILTSYWRGKTVEDTTDILPKGILAAVGMTWEEAKEFCTEGVYLACHNGNDSVTVSGLYEPMLAFIERLKEQNIFVRRVMGGEYPYHSIEMQKVAPKLLERLNNVIKNPKKRSSKWITTSVAEKDLMNDCAEYASGEYFVNNLQNPVLFEEGMQEIPKKSYCIEVAPHSLFESIFKRCYKNLNYTSLMRKTEPDNLHYFLSSIGQIFTYGFNPSIERLYPKVQWPVARGTQSIASLIKWDHSLTHDVKMYPEYHNFSTASNYTMKVSLFDSDWLFLKDHCVDGRVVFPATGYLLIAWRAMATKFGQPWNKVPIEFEGIRICRPTLLSETGPVKFMVQMMDKTNDFAIFEGPSLVCTGKIWVPDTTDEFLNFQNEIDDNEDRINDPEDYSPENVLNNKEVYKELRIRGYDYGQAFQGLVEANGEGSKGLVKWAGNWISFVDSALHLSLLSLPIRTLFVPIGIDSFKCDPRVLFNSINEAKGIRPVAQIEIESKKAQLQSEFCYFRDMAKEKEKDFIAPVEEMVKYEQEEVLPFDIMNMNFDQEKFDEEKVIQFNVKFDFNNQTLVTKGIEIKGLLPINIPRKIDNQDLLLEHYRFVPNIDMNFIEESTPSNPWSLENYPQLCLDYFGNKLLEKYPIFEEKLEKSEKTWNNNVELPKDFDRIITTKDYDQYRYLKMMHSILEGEASKEIGNETDLTRYLLENIDDFEKDILNGGIIDLEAFARPILALVAENCQHLGTLKILEICPTDHLLYDSISNIMKMNIIHKFEIDYTATRHPASCITSDSANLKTVEWNLKDASFLDLSLGEFDLIILRLNSQTSALWTYDENLQKLKNILKSSGFILTMSRDKMTSFEKLFDGILLESKLSTKLFVSENSTEVAQLEHSLLSGKDCRTIAERRCNINGMQMKLFRNSCFPLDDQQLFATTNMAVVHLDSATDYQCWLEKLQNKIKVLFADNDETKIGNTRIWIVTNCPNSGILGFANCMRLEAPYGSRIRTVFVATPSPNSDPDSLEQVLYKFDLSSPVVKEIIQKDLAFNVLMDGKLGSYRYVAVGESQQKIETQNAYLSQLQRGDLSSLDWFDSEHKFFVNLEPEMKKDCKEVLCHAYYSALNFKDIVLASGKIMPGPESSLFDCILGLEFSGRRDDTGERVMGMVPFKGIATTILSFKDFIWSVPDEWSLEEAATIPVIYITAYYALIMRGQLKRGESVLIHSGAGGVGQAAINICQSLGCKVFVSVGTEEKRQFIQKKFGIDQSYICNSRDVSFERQIKTMTKGRGVDVVLNSLTSEKLQASLRCLAANGRFLEIGKFDMQMNSRLGMFLFLNNITFHGVGLDCFFREGLSSPVLSNFIREVTNLIETGIKDGVVKPIDRTVFEIDEVEKAFRYMTSGKHIGKVLIRIRGEEIPFMKSVMKPEPVTLKALCRTWFNPYKVYVVAGGLGGVGLELVYWMVLRGARKFVLTSRSGLKSAYQRVFLKRFDIIKQYCSDYEIDIQLSTQNICYLDQCRTVLDKASSMGQVGGLFNLTLVLEDGLFENQTLEKFSKVCDPKVLGLLNLDKVSREKGLKLDHFVAFSSFSAGRGNAGQTNYGYANSAMERIIEQRVRDGLNGIAVQYGPINDVGVVAEHVLAQSDSNEESMKLLMGLSMQRINSCLDVLDRILPLKTGIYSSYVKYTSSNDKSGTDDEVIRQLCIHLNIDKRPEDECLGDIGLDSMAAVEIQQRLDRDFNITLSLADVRKITVKELKTFRDGNRHNLKQYSEDVKKARVNLSRIRFVIPTTEITVLNSIHEGKPIFCMPQLEGVFDLVSLLTKKCHRPVIGLNWTRQCSALKTLPDIVNYYYELLLRIDNGGDGEYDIVATSFGSLIAAMICKSKKMSKNVRVRTLALIDFLPMNMDTMTDTKQIANYKVQIMFDYIRIYIPERICEQSIKEILELNCERERVMKVTELMRKCVGSNLQGNDMSEIVSNSYERASLMIDYQFELRKRSKKTIRQMLLGVMQRNPQLQLDYIKLADKQEQSKLIEKKVRSMFDLEEFEEEFKDRYRLHVIKGGQDEVLGKLDKVIQEKLNDIMH